MKIHKYLLIYSISMLLMSCSVKDTGGNNPPPALQTGNLPSGVSITVDKKLLVHASQDTFVVNPPSERTTVTYRFVRTSLEIVGEDVTYEAKYWMPDMPQMPVTPLVMENISPGVIKITYNIEMGGKWQFIIKAVKNGSVLDTYEYVYEVIDK